MKAVDNMNAKTYLEEINEFLTEVVTEYLEDVTSLEMLIDELRKRLPEYKVKREANFSE